MLNGQGSPTTEPTLISLFRSAAKLTVSLIALVVALMSIFVGGDRSRAMAQDSNGLFGKQVDLEFRVVWGGPFARTYKGSIALSDGSLKLVRNLNLNSDSIGKIQAASTSVLKILPSGPSTFGGADLQLRCSTNTTIVMRFEDPDTGENVEHSESIANLLQGGWLRALDKRGCQIAIERQIHDKIRIRRFPAEPVLEAGSDLELVVEGVQTGLPKGKYALRLQLQSKETSPVSVGRAEVDVDAAGGFQAERINVALPEREGAYQLHVHVESANFLSPILPNQASITRNLDLVTFDPNQPATVIANWQPVAGVNARDASKPGYFAWLTPISTPLSDSLAPIGKTLAPMTPTAGLNLLEGWQAINPLTGYFRQPLANGDLGERPIQLGEDDSSSACLTLAPGSWLAIPVDNLIKGQPHRIRMRTPSDRPQQLIVSIKDSRPSDRVRVGNDYRVELSDRDCLDNGALSESEVLFWPSNEEMFVVVSNPSDSDEAAVLDLFIDRADMQAAGSLETAGETDARQVGVYLDKPLLSDYFSCDLATDPTTKRKLEDWSTWQDACQRLSQFLTWSEANLVVIKVHADGGALFPSRVLSPTYRYDGGVFFSDGRSQEIKDAVALLLRYSERYGVKVVLALDLTSPLPNLNRWKESPALYQQQLSENADRQSGLYNPLNARVRAEVSGVIRELVSRYGSSPAFAGVQLNLEGDSFLLFGGDKWGFDQETLGKFQQAYQAKLPESREDLASAFSGSLRLAFLNWRAEELSKFFLSLAGQVTASGSDRKLYLNATRLWEANPSQLDFFDPDAIVRNPGEFLLAKGLKPDQLRGRADVVFLQGAFYRQQNSGDADNWIRVEAARRGLANSGSQGSAGALVVDQPTTYQLPQASDTNQNNSGINIPETLYPLNLGSARLARQRIIEQYFEADLQFFAIGAWLPLGHPDQSVRLLQQTIREFPNKRMTDFPTDQDKVNVKFRTVYDGEVNYLQVINNSPWSETVKLKVQFHGALPTIRPLANRDVEIACTDSLPLGNSLSEEWTLQVDAYDIVGLRIGARDFRLREAVNTPPVQVVESISAELQAFEEIIARASDPTQQTPLTHAFGEFEQWRTDGQPAGWSVSSLPNVRIQQAVELPRSGGSSLVIENRNKGKISAWVQSGAVPLPSTGRLMLQAWLRAPPERASPTVRLSVLGRKKNGDRFERALELGGKSGNPIPNDWGTRPATLFVNDIPKDQLTELFVAVEVIGVGKVWVDDLEVLQTWLLPNEKIYLQGMLFVAKQELTEDNPFPAEQLLDGHWGRYLAEFEPMRFPNSSNLQQVSAPTMSTPLPQTNNGWKQTPNVFQQLRDSMRERWQR